MRLSVSHNLAQVGRELGRIRKQVPFATATALTGTAFKGREVAQDAMKRDLDRPTPWTVRGVQVIKARKRRLVSSVLIEPKRAEYLLWQIEGGVRTPRRRVLIIGQGRRNQYGNTPGFRQLRTRLLAKPAHFEATINGTSGIWRRKSRARGSLELVALYSTTARYRPRYDFAGPIERAVRRVFPREFDRAMRRAIRTARR